MKLLPLKSNAPIIVPVRNYIDDVIVPVGCWNCKKPRLQKDRIICSNCNHLQDSPKNWDFFKLLGIPQSFHIDSLLLTQRFRKLQSIVHPDKFENKSRKERRYSSDWSTLANKAYKTLAAPIDRGQYILQLHGEKLPVANTDLDQNFLLTVMDRNEEIEDAQTVEKLQRLNQQIVNDINNKYTEINKYFQENLLNEAKMALVQLRYLQSSQEGLKKKLESLIGV